MNQKNAAKQATTADQTPQHPSIGRRLASFIYDTFLLFGCSFIATMPLVIATDSEKTTQGWPFTFYILIVCFLFLGYCWTHGGQTLGMKVWKIKVVQEDGSPMNWHSAFTRFIAALANLALLGIGYLWVFFDPKKQALHDRLSHSHLILEENAKGKKS